MKNFFAAPVLVSVGTLSVVAALGCSDPFSFDSSVAAEALSAGEEEEEEEICPASEEWLPGTPPLDLFQPLPHPAGECPFYRGAWQNFLVATQPDAEGRPAFQFYPSIDSMFKSSKPKNAPGQRAWLGDIKQAGGRQIVVDQNGRSLYYGIHVNQAYANFMAENNLTTVADVQNADPRLFFPAGVVEFKSAWQDITDEPAADYATFIQTIGLVPRLSKGPQGEILEDRNDPIERKMALLALHVVYTYPGHPEFIWGSFEHTTARQGEPDTSAKDRKRDVAPTFELQNPTDDDPDNVRITQAVSATDFVLYKGGTPANRANQPLAETQLNLDAEKQSFPGQQTSIYRMFPASKSHSIDADAAISSLNFNVGQLFKSKAAVLARNDKRGFYRQVGAVWMDKPDFFTLNSPIANDDSSPLVRQGGDAARRATALADIAENGGDSAYSLLAGEDRLSSTAMESFTQGPGSFSNCFTCHNTQAVTARGIPSAKDITSPVLLDPKLLNVSHILSQFVLEETQ
ncbi:MAG: hypothetical protein ABI895_07400 [Deltaproteobacteria bacterium]